MNARPEVVATSRQVLARHARTFNLAGTLLPPDRLDDAAVVYAFCRLVDDTVDEAPSTRAARDGLAAIEAEVRGVAPRPVVEAFLDVSERRGFPLEAAEELMRGVASDLGDVLVADDEELLRYCYRVAGTVGLMMCGVLGVTEPRATPHAIDLGVGMQITNICRDVLEDAGRGRVYLPRTRLEAAGTTPEALLEGARPRGPVGRVVADLLTLADRYYASGEAGLRYIPLRPRPAIAAAARVYHAIGTRIRRRHFDVLAGRTVVPAPDKARLLVRAAVGSLVAGWQPPQAHDRALHILLRGLPGVAGSP